VDFDRHTVLEAGMGAADDRPGHGISLLASSTFTVAL
jgi:hypothetical protein